MARIRKPARAPAEAQAQAQAQTAPPREHKAVQHPSSASTLYGRVHRHDDDAAEIAKLRVANAQLKSDEEGLKRLEDVREKLATARPAAEAARRDGESLREDYEKLKVKAERLPRDKRLFTCREREAQEAGGGGGPPSRPEPRPRRARGRASAAPAARRTKTDPRAYEEPTVIKPGRELEATAAAMAENHRSKQDSENVDDAARRRGRLPKKWELRDS